MKTTATLFLIACMLVNFVSAFHVAPVNVVVRVRNNSPTALWSFPEPFERAVQCSEQYGLCNVDELLALAEELEYYQGSFFEDDLREKEIKDRNDVADILRLEAELELRQEYLRNANLFKADVEEAVARKERDEYIELMDTFSEY